MDGQKWYADGTFFSVTGLDHFAQLYIISNKVTLKENFVAVIPKTFALLKNKAHATYEQLFNNMETIAGQRISPSVVSCDFEMAVIKTIEKNISGSNNTTMPIPSVSIDSKKNGRYFRKKNPCQSSIA